LFLKKVENNQYSFLLPNELALPKMKSMDPPIKQLPRSSLCIKSTSIKWRRNSNQLINRKILTNGLLDSYAVIGLQYWLESVTSVLLDRIIVSNISLQPIIEKCYIPHFYLTIFMWYFQQTLEFLWRNANVR
jgi:hypothetical protein